MFQQNILIFIASKKYIEENELSKESDFEKCKIIIPKSVALKQHLEEYCNENSISIKPNYELEDVDMIESMVLSGCGILFSIKIIFNYFYKIPLCSEKCHRHGIFVFNFIFSMFY